MHLFLSLEVFQRLAWSTELTELTELTQLTQLSELIEGTSRTDGQSPVGRRAA